MSWTASEAIGAEQPPFTTDRQTGVVDLLPLNSHFGVYWQPFDHRIWSRIRIASPWPPQSEGQHSSDLLYAVGVRRAVDLLMRSFTRSESLSALLPPPILPVEVGNESLERARPLYPLARTHVWCGCGGSVHRGLEPITPREEAAK